MLDFACSPPLAVGAEVVAAELGVIPPPFPGEHVVRTLRRAHATPPPHPTPPPPQTPPLLCLALARPSTSSLPLPTLTPPADFP